VSVYGSFERHGADVFCRWRVKFMEENLRLLDFENVDQMIQIHGSSPTIISQDIAY
jgi:hypothetical protein